jgi:hypothetical protein
METLLVTGSQSLRATHQNFLHLRSLQIETASSRIAHYWNNRVAPKELKPVKVLTDSFDNDMEICMMLKSGRVS